MFIRDHVENIGALYTSKAFCLYQAIGSTDADTDTDTDMSTSQAQAQAQAKRR